MGCSLSKLIQEALGERGGFWQVYWEFCTHACVQELCINGQMQGGEGVQDTKVGMVIPGGGKPAKFYTIGCLGYKSNSGSPKQNKKTNVTQGHEASPPCSLLTSPDLCWPLSLAGECPVKCPGRPASFSQLPSISTHWTITKCD